MGGISCGRSGGGQFDFTSLPKWNARVRSSSSDYPESLAGIRIGTNGETVKMHAENTDADIEDCG